MNGDLVEHLKNSRDKNTYETYEYGIFTDVELSKADLNIIINFLEGGLK